MAVSLARKAAEEGEQSTAAAVDQGDDVIKVGDFVAVVEAESTLQQPRILLARIQAFVPDRMAALLWLSRTVAIFTAYIWMVHAGQNPWTALFPCPSKPPRAGRTPIAC